jgi:O-antigen/teichoic acid export membrane protein
MFIKCFLFLSGVGVSRLSLLLFGLLLSRNFSPEYYSNYVTFLTLGNLLSSVAVMGTIPLILSYKPGKNKREDGLTPLVITGVTGTLVVCIVFLLVVGVLEQAGVYRNEYSIPISSYVLGYSLVAISVALFNQKKKHFSASVAWAISGVFSFAMGSIALLLSNSIYSDIHTLFSVGWLVSGLVFLFFAINFKLKNILDRVCKITTTINSVVKTYYCGLFGVPFLTMFYFLNQSTSNIENNEFQGSFSLAFQLFGMVILIPGTLAGIFVPNIVEENNINSRVLIRIRMLYASIGLFWVLAVYTFLPNIFAAFKLSDSGTSSSVVITMQIAGFLAAVTALDMQFLVAKRRFNVLLIGSFLWAVTILCFVWGYSINDLSCSRAILLAYAFLLLFFYVANWHNKYRGFKRDG